LKFAKHYNNHIEQTHFLSNVRLFRKENSQNMVRQISHKSYKYFAKITWLKFIYLLVMRWGNPLKEDLYFCRVDVGIYPSCPCSECTFKSFHPIHVFHNLISHLDIIPSKKYPFIHNLITKIEFNINKLLIQINFTLNHNFLFHGINFKITM